MRVVVVGGGCAGLTAALALAAAGIDIDVVEAGPRVGGRVRTVRAPFIGGQHVESGAEWVDTNQHRMLSLLRRHRLSLVGPGQQWARMRRWAHVDGVLLSPDDLRVRAPELDEELDTFERACAALASGVDPDAPQLAIRAAELDGRSLAELIDALGLGRTARWFVTAATQAEFAAEPASVSQLFVAQQRAVTGTAAADGEVRSHRVAEGLDRLIAAMADDASAAGARIATGEAVTAIEWGSDGAEVVTSLRRVRADHVVLACSLIPLRSIRFAPTLPLALGRAVHEIGYGAVTKTALQYRGRRWSRGYTNTSDAIQRTYEPTEDQPGEFGALMAYTGGDAGRRLGRLDEVDRLAAVAGRLQVVFGVQDPLAGFSRAWSAEGRFGGSYAVFGPGQVTAHWATLRAPWGPIHLAGEHTASWTGYMEGAVESGQRVADAILGSR